MVNNYWKKTRKTLFPTIIDWTDSQDNIRYEKDLNKLDWFEWFFMHPSAYILTTFSSSIINIILFGFLSYFFYDRLGFLSILFFTFSIAFIYEFYLKLQKYKLNKELTFYDILMRDNEIIKCDVVK